MWENYITTYTGVLEPNTAKIKPIIGPSSERNQKKGQCSKSGIGSTPTFLYFDLYLYSAYAAHYV